MYKDSTVYKFFIYEDLGVYFWGYYSYPHSMTEYDIINCRAREVGEYLVI